MYHVARKYFADKPEELDDAVSAYTRVTINRQNYYILVLQTILYRSY